MFPKCSLDVPNIATLSEHSPNIETLSEHSPNIAKLSEHSPNNATLSEHSANIRGILRACWVLPVEKCYFEGYLSVAGYQQNSSWKIAVSHRCFSLSTDNLIKFNIPSQVFFTWSHLKNRFLKNLCIILFVSEKGLHATFLVSYCWYDSKHTAN